MSPLRFEVPVKLISAANAREHHMARATRVKKEREAVYRVVPWLDLPAAYDVRLTRLGGKRLDDDNLHAALKGARDAVATRLRVDDASTVIRWSVAQEPQDGAPTRVRIEVESVYGGLAELRHEEDAALSRFVYSPGKPAPAEPPAKDWRALVKPNHVPGRGKP